MSKLQNIMGRKLSNLFIEGSYRALNGVDFAFLEVWLAALTTDPRRHGMERQEVAAPVDMNGCRRASHCSATVTAIHQIFLARK